MKRENGNLQNIIDEFDKRYEMTQGGIFRKDTRKKILTKEGISGKGESKNTFWYRQRENVKTTLLDLELFIEAADEEVDKVVTAKSMEPIVGALLDQPNVPINLNRAEIAQLFIRKGFEYLQKSESANMSHMTSSHLRTVGDALDLANYLLQYFKPKENRWYYSSSLAGAY